MHKPHNSISHWLNVLWKKTAQLNQVYPSVFPLHTQSHSSWCSKGTSVNDLCNPRTPTLGFSWRTWRRRNQASGKQQVLHHTPGLWARLHWIPTAWQEVYYNWISAIIPFTHYYFCFYLKPFTKLIKLHWTWLDHVAFLKKSLAVSDFLLILRTNSRVTQLDTSIINSWSHQFIAMEMNKYLFLHKVDIYH